MRVYVLDNDEPMCRELAQSLQQDGWIIEWFSSPLSFLEQLDALCDGTVLLCLELPTGQGIEMLKELSERQPSWPVIVVSSTNEVGDAVAAFRAGAIHFLRKPCQPSDVRAALAESLVVGRERREAVARERRARAVNLTPREREVLAAMAEGHQSKVIAWNLGLSVRTVDMHRSNILTKLSARNASQAVAIARELSLADF